MLGIDNLDRFLLYPLGDSMIWLSLAFWTTLSAWALDRSVIYEFVHILLSAWSKLTGENRITDFSLKFVLISRRTKKVSLLSNSTHKAKFHQKIQSFLILIWILRSSVMLYFSFLFLIHSILSFDWFPYYHFNSFTFTLLISNFSELIWTLMTWTVVYWWLVTYSLLVID